MPWSGSTNSCRTRSIKLDTSEVWRRALAVADLGMGDMSRVVALFR
jgi:hypothetical protein